jgi:hypothetical protein
VRSGQALERAIAAFPEHAHALREDLELVAAIRSSSRAPGLREAAAAASVRRRLLADLAAVRDEQSRGSWPVWRLARPRAFAIAAALGVLLLAVAAVAGLMAGSGSAQATTLDGVVVETAPQSIVVQTAAGLQTVSVTEDADVLDPAGSEVGASAIEVGEVIDAVVKRVSGNSLAAVKVQRRAAGALPGWCQRNPVRCREVEPKLPRAVVACQAGPACDESSAVVSGDDGQRLRQLAQRCQSAGGQGCMDLLRYCRSNAGVCSALSGWLLSLLDLSENAAERLRQHEQRCRAGSILDCRELRLLCESRPNSCAGDNKLPRPVRQVH